MIDTRTLFNQIVEAARATSLPFNPSDKELDLIYRGFLGLFDKRQTKLRRSALPWSGWKHRDGSIDEDKRLQSLQSAFYRLFHYHSGRESAYLGTIINASMNLGTIYQDMGFIPYPDTAIRDWWKLDKDDPAYQDLTEKRDINRQAEKAFTDYCDTFCQVAVFLFSKGRTSSVNGDIWRKALGMETA